MLAIIASLISAVPVRSEPAQPSKPRRIVSLNLCTDQLLFALADAHQITAVSRFSRDPEYSYLHRQALKFPVVRGVLEEILHLKPDLVLAGAFTKGVVRAALKNFKIRAATFAPAHTVAAGRRDIMRMARLLGHPDRGQRLVNAIDRTLADAKQKARRMARARRSAGLGRLTVMQLQRRLFVSGERTLLGNLFSHIQLVNQAHRLGVTSVARVQFEAVLNQPPDILVIDSLATRYRDQGQSILGHPALARVVPRQSWIVVPQRLVICSGPSLPAAIRTLITGIERVGQRAPISTP